MNNGHPDPSKLPEPEWVGPPLPTGDPLTEVKRLKEEPAHFSCLGLGCLPWAVLTLLLGLLWILR